ncbi:hypothetical protein BDV59DRAFT_194324 [Aspergillus ambiguus]|uniref:ferric reductase family protein n=1 Tax=Aspergillus ambiguus TaxID=176160 RepID=UPI003CCDCA93
MQGLDIYAIAAGGILAGLLLIRAVSTLTNWTNLISVLVSRHLTLPLVVQRHQLCGPWTRASVFVHLSFVAVNVFLVFFRVKSLSSAGHRAGKLALVNLVFPLSTIHLSHLADLLAITLRTCRKIHRTTGWIGFALLSFHVAAVAQAPGFNFSLNESKDLWAVIAGISLGLIAILSIQWLRRLSYEIFLRTHQALAGLVVYGTWRHLPTRSHHSKLYLLVALGIFGFTFFLQLVTFLYRNGLFAGRGSPRALVSFTTRKSETEDTVATATHIRILLPRAIKIEAGQYINLWIPSVSLWSWAQTHPFTVTTWSKGVVDTMELLVQPRGGLSAELLRYTKGAVDGSVSFLALFTGPHGTNIDASHYESVLVVAGGFGIAAAIPHLKKLIHGYNTCTSQVRRLHLVWQVESIDEIAAAKGLLNNLLDDDIMDAGYILNISMYVRRSLEQKEKPFGRHKRACLYRGVPDYQHLIALEASGEQIERLSNVQDDQGGLLVMVSTTAEIRDKLRETVRKYLHEGVKLVELEYQPCVT